MSVISKCFACSGTSDNIIGLCQSCYERGLAKNETELTALRTTLAQAQQELKDARKAGTPYSLERDKLNALILANQELYATVQALRGALSIANAFFFGGAQSFMPKHMTDEGTDQVILHGRTPEQLAVVQKAIGVALAQGEG